MANISIFLDKIKKAIYGKEVRDSIHDAIQRINEESSDAVRFAKTAQDSAREHASIATTAANKAEEVAVKTPYIDNNGNWWVWNPTTEEYIDSGVYSKGLQGVKGDTGKQGIQGIQGLKGDTGEQGIQGVQGLKGDTGEQGIQGVQGLKGDTGEPFHIAGSFEIESDLNTAYPNGDGTNSYLVDGVVFVWDGTEWQGISGGGVTDYNDLTNKPTSLPANGGDADTVGGFTVGTNVPANAVFTDTVYDDTDVQNDIENLQTGKENTFAKKSAFNKNFGTGINDVCRGNDSRLSNSRNASDVYAWAKSANKPTYTASEVGALPDDTQLFSGDYDDLTNKPTIPPAYSLPTASATVKGGIKIGGGLTIESGVLSAVGGGGVVYQIQSTTNHPSPSIPTFPAVFNFGTAYANHKILVFTNNDFEGVETLDASGIHSISNDNIVTYYALAL